MQLRAFHTVRCGGEPQDDYICASKRVSESGGSVSRPSASASGPAVTSAAEPGRDSAARSSTEIIRREVCEVELAARSRAFAWRETPRRIGGRIIQISDAHCALREFRLLFCFCIYLFD